MAHPIWIRKCVHYGFLILKIKRLQVPFEWCFYTYIHIWSLQPFSQDYWHSFSHALILYISGGTYSLKSTPDDRFLWKLFMAILFTLRVFSRNLLRENRRRNTFPFGVRPGTVSIPDRIKSIWMKRVKLCKQSVTPLNLTQMNQYSFQRWCCF